MNNQYSFLKVRVGDILISGPHDDSHLMKLERVSYTLNKAGLKLKRNMWDFLREEITYLGLKINKESTVPLPEKVTAMKRAPHA